jgi:hypothetical protein
MKIQDNGAVVKYPVELAEPSILKVDEEHATGVIACQYK